MGLDERILPSDALRSAPMAHRASHVRTTTSQRCPLNPGKSRFYPDVIGLSRMGTHQTSYVTTEKQIQRWVFFHCKQVDLIRSLGAETHVVNRLADFLIWKTYANYLSELDSVEEKPIFAYRLKSLCMNYASEAGHWRQRVQKKFPLLFWKFGRMPGWIN